MIPPDALRMKDWARIERLALEAVRLQGTEVPGGAGNT